MQKIDLRTSCLGGLLAGTLFLSAFLLFQVQPLLGRYILPWFGGMPEVWTACMLFFQVFLLGGYAYAHALSRLPLRGQAAIHGTLVLIAAATLSVIPDAALRPSPEDVPVLKILWICAVSVGAAYFVLAASSPMIQSWFSRALPGRNAYRLYALSNVGSLLALASFPFVFEPLMSRDATARLWSAGFWGYTALVVLCAAALIRRSLAGSGQDTDAGGPTETIPVTGTVHKTTAEATHTATGAAQPSWRDWLMWLVLPMTASTALLAVTNKVTLDIAVIPFLWVLPLTLYLLSFVLCFDHPRWYRRGAFMAVLVAAIGGMIWIDRRGDTMHAATIIAIYAVTLFACCMICHGQLYQRRPQSRHLTGFYLMIALGGALGGVFVAVLAPLIFTYYHELQLSLLATVLLVLMSQKNVSSGFAKRRRWWAALILLAGLGGIFLDGGYALGGQRVLAASRNFFGTLTILERWPDDPEMHMRVMQHGTTYHGLQLQDPDRQTFPTSYYSPDSGIGILLRHWPNSQPRRIGGVGLGVGTIAAYGQSGDVMRFYEINPEVVRMAYAYFTYLDDSAAQIEMVMGDARLSMEHEAPQQYDVLALDAFSSDAIPVHLLTVEAFEVYLSHLAPEGVLAVHISTRYLDLQSVIWKLAEHRGLHSRWIQSYDDTQPGVFASDWILLSRSPDVLDEPAIRTRQSRPYADLDRVPLWTDDHINLLKVIRPRSR